MSKCAEWRGLDVEAFDCCTCLYVCIASAVCDFLISAVWRNLTDKGVHQVLCEIG